MYVLAYKTRQWENQSYYTTWWNRILCCCYTVDAGGLSRLGLVELDHGQLTAPHDVTSTSSTDELTFPRRTVAEMTDPVMLAAVNMQLSNPSRVQFSVRNLIEHELREAITRRIKNTVSYFTNLLSQKWRSKISKLRCDRTNGYCLLQCDKEKLTCYRIHTALKDLRQHLVQQSCSVWLHEYSSTDEHVVFTWNTALCLNKKFTLFILW